MTTYTFGVFYYTHTDYQTNEHTNKLQLGHHDDPTTMPDDWDETGVSFSTLLATAHDVITHEDRYGSLAELEHIKNTYFRKLGEMTFDENGTYLEYHDSPPNYNDTNGVIHEHLKPVYQNWRANAF